MYCEEVGDSSCASSNLETFCEDIDFFRVLRKLAPLFRKAEEPDYANRGGRTSIIPRRAKSHNGDAYFCPPWAIHRCRIITITSNLTSQTWPRLKAHTTQYHHFNSCWSIMYRQEEKRCVGRVQRQSRMFGILKTGVPS